MIAIVPITLFTATRRLSRSVDGLLLRWRRRRFRRALRRYFAGLKGIYAGGRDSGPLTVVCVIGADGTVSRYYLDGCAVDAEDVEIMGRVARLSKEVSPLLPRRGG